MHAPSLSHFRRAKYSPAEAEGGGKTAVLGRGRMSEGPLAGPASSAIRGCEAAPLLATMTRSKPSGATYVENTLGPHDIETYISNH
jgi:hypothetical protein